MKKHPFIAAGVVLALLAWGGYTLLGPGSPWRAPEIGAGNGDGLWRGHFDINRRGRYEFTALHVGGRLIALSPDARVAYRGDVAFDDGRYHAEMDMYFINGSPFDRVTLDGDVTSAQRIEARFTTLGAKDEGSLVLEYDRALYEKGASLERVRGRWILYEGFTIARFTIKDDGKFHGADANGCDYQGLIEVINPDYNAYRTRLLASSCDGLGGEFAGMAFLTGSLAEDDTLHVQVANDNRGLYMPIVRDRG